jgi:DNA-binding CsgD family transcriptional regulator
VALSLQGSRKRGPFERADLELFARLAPHVTRALEIRERLAAAALSSKSMGEALNRNRVAVMMLDARGSILQANALASAHLAKGGPMRRKSDGTLAVDGAAGRILLRWLGNGAPEGVGAEGSIRVPREGRLPLSLSIAPFPDAKPQWFQSEVRWLLTIADPEQAAQVSVATLSELYGLTAREAEVAALVAAGLSPPDIASRHGTSVHTVRTQLKAVFRKTGWHTQADLIRNLVLMSGG